MGCEESVMDDSNNEYDSTWDDESEEEQFGMMRLTKQRARARPRNLAAAEDMQNFRRRCRENTHAYQSNGQMTRQVSQENRHADQSNGQMTRQVSQECQNLLFYRNRIPFRPDGVYIEQFHKYWFGDYTRLERVHSYIQCSLDEDEKEEWKTISLDAPLRGYQLFPTQEPGVNNSAHVLTPTEIRYFHEDVTVKKRLFKSYMLMLDFYGIELVSQETGKVKRAVNWKERFANLNRNTHNNLRITRILKCLGLLGFRHYQAPLVHFFLEETLVEDTLPRVKHSVLDYFMFAVLDKSERKKLIRFAFWNFEPKEKFVWCPRRIRNKFLKEKGTEKGSHKLHAVPNEGMSSDSNSQSNHNDLMNSTEVQNKAEIKTDTNEDTSDEKSLSSKIRNDENVSSECQDSEKQALPVPAAGNAKTSNANEETQALSGVDSQKEDSKARNKKIPNSVQKATEKSDENDSEYVVSTKQSKVLSGDKNFDNSTASDESTNENLTQTSNHSSTSESVANKTPLSGGNSGSDQQDHENQEDKSEQGNKDDLKSQHTDRDSKENDSEEIQKSGSELPEDSAATGTATDNEENQSVESNAEDSLTDEHVSNAVTSHYNENSDSTEVKNREDTESEQGIALRSDVNSSQVIPGKDTETGESTKEKSAEDKKTEIGCVRDGGTENEENIQTRL
ncbi:opioid growth factor receptor-like protein 1 isoform X3 [Pangasianodon hypophthalmus]|uniref:opioid growth factor receptor-like protein 1 isoform X2 n=1 Tax=Pangasianodon hypophthalmus TaxID=310915 RepID=UPI0023082A21|nr:opioid growth factor receptor-like protein 1 isoform X2 [Pangasianodon hypophthalmus]XP_053083218.1 opioid growth factor receptor-like protein 1 isoform X3 [Pangasianodon hypophthalmus]